MPFLTTDMSFASHFSPRCWFGCYFLKFIFLGIPWSPFTFRFFKLEVKGGPRYTKKNKFLKTLEPNPLLRLKCGDKAISVSRKSILLSKIQEYVLLNFKTTKIEHKDGKR